MNILKDVEAVIFDMDGTLIDSMWIWRDIDKEFLGKRDIKMPTDLQKNIEGMSFHETAQYFKDTFLLEESLEEIKDVWNNMAYERYSNGMPLKKGALGFLEAIKENGIKTAIATSNSRYLAEACLKDIGIEKFFDAVVTACEVSKGKPAPDIYIEAAKKLAVNDRNKCLVFEDIPMGILAGNNAGMKTCAVYDSYSVNMDKEKKELANYYINDFDQLMRWEYEV